MKLLRQKRKEGRNEMHKHRNEVGEDTKRTDADGETKIMKEGCVC
jgi:hypothetical protein